MPTENERPMLHDDDIFNNIISKLHVAIFTYCEKNYDFKQEEFHLSPKYTSKEIKERKDKLMLYSLLDMSEPIFTIGFEGLQNGADIIA